MSALHEVPGVQQRQKGSGGGRGWEGEGAYCVEGAGCQLGRTKRVLWTNAGDGRSKGAHPVPRTAHLENGHGGKLDVMCVFLA